MRKLLACIFVLSITGGLIAQDISDMSSIPAEVMKNASVITRAENILFEVKDINSAVQKTRHVYTVMDERGKEALLIRHYSNKQISIEDVDIKIFDQKGKQLGKYKKKDMNTVAYGDGLVDDGKLSYLDLPNSGYPVTVEHEYVIKFSGTLAYPSFNIQHPGEGVVFSKFTAKVPRAFDLRHKAFNTAIKPEVHEDGEYKVYEWFVSNLTPFEYEKNAGNAENPYPRVILAPNKFEHYGYEGTMNNWNQFGQWYIQLKKGLDFLPDASKKYYRSMVDTIQSDREKVRAIYTYLQNNFRYVSIQLGIGGVKPFPADFTEQKKYGDCKGLSNYMHAVLTSVGIRSHVALISRYDVEPVEQDFPCNLFNHVILCVPMAKDTIWLECTSKTNEFGVLGIGTENRNALLITETGGLLVATPKSSPASNSYSSLTDIQISADGSGKTRTTIRSNGEPKDELHYFLFNKKKDEQLEYLVYGLGFKQANHFEVAKSGEDMSSQITIDLQLEKLPEFSTSSKMFLAPRLYKLWTSKLPKAEGRKTDFYFDYPFVLSDTTVFRLPDGYKPGAIPSKKSLQNEFASYQTHYWFDEQKNAIYSTAALLLKQYKIPAAKFDVVKSFFDEVLADDGQRIVIEKK